MRDPDSDIGAKKRPAKPRRAFCKSAKRSVSNALEQATSAGQSNFGDLAMTKCKFRLQYNSLASEVELETPSVTIELVAIAS